MHPPLREERMEEGVAKQNNSHPVDSDTTQKDSACVFVRVCVCACEPTSPVSHDAQMDAKSFLVLCGTLVGVNAQTVSHNETYTHAHTATPTHTVSCWRVRKHIHMLLTREN